MPTLDVAFEALGAAAIACAVAALLLAALRVTGLAQRVLDRPNARSLHGESIPRIGGLGVLAGAIAGIGATSGALPAPVWVGMSLVAAVSALDDLRGVGAVPRLALHLAGAGVVAATSLGAMGVLAAFGATLAIAWAVNLYNFMDGSDALAGTMGWTGFGALAIAAAWRGDPPLAMAAAAIAGACVGFLVHNLPPARVFMGDLGSTSLGLLAGAIGLVGVERGLWSVWLPAAVFMPFVFDATATLVDRAMRGARVWEAHREHAYQKLNLSGLGHRRTAWAYGALMAVNAAQALAAHRASAEAVGFGASLAIHAALWWVVRRAWSRREAGSASAR